MASEPAAPARAAPASDVRATWERAEIWMSPPGMGFRNGRLSDDEIRAALARLEPGVILPTVILMHGCGHTKPAAWSYAHWLAKAGYAAILPDSFAREGRPPTCNTWNQRRFAGAPIDQVWAMREEEIRYAAAQARTLPWVDRDNLFLMGHDEGGEAAAHYGGGEFKARIVSGALCRRGVAATMDRPVLVLASAADPLYKGAPADACARAFSDARTPVVSAVLLEALHDLSGHPEARVAIIDFLERHRAR